MGLSYGWCGTESNDFIAPILGQPFENNYPFKKFVVESDAPIFQNRLEFFGADGPANTTVNIKIAFQKGKVFDLFKIEKLINRPVIVTKLDSGLYRIIKTNGAIDYTEDELESIRVPVMINGSEMEDVDPGDLAGATDSTLSLQLKFNSLGNLPTPTSTGGGNNEGIVYLMLKKRPSNNTTPPDPRYYQQIIGAEIVSFSQLKLMGAVKDGVLNETHPYVKDRKRITILDLNGLMRYRGVGSTESILSNKGPYDASDFGGFIEKRVDDLATERSTQVLTLAGDSVAPYLEEQFNDHLFTRIT